jgi:hypothetical protein
MLIVHGSWFMVHGNSPMGIAHSREDACGVGVPPALERFRTRTGETPIPLLCNALQRTMSHER